MAESIKPYYQDDAVTLYNADCRDVLPMLERHDLLLTDPPYGIDAGNMNLGGYASSRIQRDDWDKTRPDDELISDAIKHCGRSVIWGGNYFSLPPSRAFLVWDKTPEIQGRSFAEAEIAWCSWDAVARIFRFSPTRMNKVHKTEKPVGLIVWCIEMAGQATTILDPFAGSGTTGVAAKLEGRKATLIEISERYCEIAAKRLCQKLLF